MLSLVIPVYKNELNIPSLVDELEILNRRWSDVLEVVFVVDGSPDRSFELLEKRLSTSSLRSQLLLLSRNFGAFSAVRAGLAAARGDDFAVMAADLQEPISLIDDFYNLLRSSDVEIVIATRKTRVDSIRKKFTSALAWSIYRRFVIREMPVGGVDVFACTKRFRNCLLQLRESNTSLIGLLFWLGFKRQIIYYDRLERKIGKSSWTFWKSFRYFLDGCFSFSDLPVRVLTASGALGLGVTILFGASIIVGRLFGNHGAPGYAALACLIMFFGSLNCFGLGIIGEYVWRAYENTKARPDSIVSVAKEYRLES